VCSGVGVLQEEAVDGMSMSFEEAHGLWVGMHLCKRSGERQGRLERGHGHGEKLFLRNVWWPVYGHLEHLHPEYEVLDWRGRSYFADFAWLPGHVNIIFEIKGYGPHVRDMDRKRYCEELNRETFLQGMGFRVVSFSYDDVADRPAVCISLLRLLLSRYQAFDGKISPTSLVGKEVVMFARRLGGSVRPSDLEAHLGVNHRTAMRYLRELCERGQLRPVRSGTGAKTMRYEVVRKGLLEDKC
jgi:hypothetical protein